MKINRKDKKLFKIYLNMQKLYYSNGTNNHDAHNKNIDYWNILLEPLLKKKIKQNDLILDYGCGKGRNLLNANSLGYRQGIGVDISKNNIDYCKKSYSKLNNKFILNDGYSLKKIKNVSFVMSTITLQHIPVHKIRYSIISSIFKILKKNGIFTLQMGYNKNLYYKTFYYNNFIVRKLHDYFNIKFCYKGKFNDYYDNNFNAKSTNGADDVTITNKNFLLNDLKKVGFKILKHEIRKSFLDKHEKWIYVTSQK
jgi:SAM-dependent methyltransferase